MKTCAYCDSKGVYEEQVIRRVCRACGISADAPLDDLAQHLRDSGEYAVMAIGECMRRGWTDHAAREALRRGVGIGPYQMEFTFQD